MSAWRPCGWDQTIWNPYLIGRTYSEGCPLLRPITRKLIAHGGMNSPTTILFRAVRRKGSVTALNVATRRLNSSERRVLNCASHAALTSLSTGKAAPPQKRY